MAALRTGGEVDAMCTKCRMVLAHTILAMVGSKPVRVQCNTCGGQHNYRSGETETKTKAKSASAGTTRAPRATPVRVSFDEMMAQKSGIARPYSPKVAFLMDEVVQHPTFGQGFVSAVRPDKIEVTFRGGVKTLVHRR